MVGYLAAIGASLCLGLAIAVVRFAFEGGTNGLTVALLRTVLVAIGAGAFCVLTGRKVSIPWRLWAWSLGLGLLMANMFYANLAAVQFIPIGLAALLFFTYPPMVALGNSAILRRWPSGLILLALLLAFAGLAMMLGTSVAAFDLTGIALSLSAAATCAGNVLGSARLMQRHDRWVIFFHMALVAAATLAAIAVAQGAIRVPTSPAGWAGLIGVAVMQGSGIPLFYVSIGKIGPERSAMINNLQPVISIAAAYLLFAELLTPTQFGGAALVFAGIVLMHYHDWHRKPARLA